MDNISAYKLDILCCHLFRRATRCKPAAHRASCKENERKNRAEREVTSSCPNFCNESIQIVQFSSHMPLALFNTRLETLQIWSTRKVWQVSKDNRKLQIKRHSGNRSTIRLLPYVTHTKKNNNMTSTVLQWWGDGSEMMHTLMQYIKYSHDIL